MEEGFVKTNREAIAHAVKRELGEKIEGLRVVLSRSDFGAEFYEPSSELAGTLRAFNAFYVEVVIKAHVDVSRMTTPAQIEGVYTYLKSKSVEVTPVPRRPEPPIIEPLL